MSIEASPVLIVGGGPAGLATAAELRRRGVDSIVVERSQRIGDSWRRHYDRLHLHTANFASSLPGTPFPPSEGLWVSRNGVVAYLEAYAEQRAIDVRLGVAATRLDRREDLWHVSTAQGDVFHSARVVVATGYNHSPYVPAWPGREAFRRPLLHSSDYRNAREFRHRKVLVVGCGNSGAEIAVDLVQGGAQKVWMSVRTPPTVTRRQGWPFPNPVLGAVSEKLPVRLVDSLTSLLAQILQ